MFKKDLFGKELVFENNKNEYQEKISDKEIWKMLKPKMEKNGLVSKASRVEIEPEDYLSNGYNVIKMYDVVDVEKAVALAYRVGYLRAKKGRPFKYKSKDENK